jgi:hypothetical protein
MRGEPGHKGEGQGGQNVRDSFARERIMGVVRRSESSVLIRSKGTGEAHRLE